MPIRKRGNSWQVDSMTDTGIRIRKSFPTKRAAREFLGEVRPPKQSRNSTDAPSRLPSPQSRRPRRITGSMSPQEPLSPPPEPRTPASSLERMSGPPRNGGPVSLLEPGKAITAISANSSPCSELPPSPGKASRTSKAPSRAWSQSRTKSSSEPSTMPTLPRPSSSFAAATALFAQEPSSPSPSVTSTSKQRPSPRAPKTARGSQRPSPPA